MFVALAYVLFNANYCCRVSTIRS